MQLLQTTTHLLLIEDNDIKIGSIIQAKDYSGIAKITELKAGYYKAITLKDNIELGISYNQISDWVKVVASLPEIEGLPLLPPFEEEIDIERLAKDTILTENIIPTANIHGQIVGFQIGYKAAQSHSKQFSLEDIEKAYNKGKHNALLFGSDSQYSKVERYIESLSTPKVPKEFILEYWCTNTTFQEDMDCPCFSLADNDCKFKITTNSEGKQVIQGTYKY